MYRISNRASEKQGHVINAHASETGSVLIVVMIFLLAIPVLIGGLWPYVKQQMTNSNRINAKLTAKNIQEEIEMYLRDPIAWKHMKAASGHGNSGGSNGNGSGNGSGNGGSGNGSANGSGSGGTGSGGNSGGGGKCNVHLECLQERTDCASGGRLWPLDKEYDLKCVYDPTGALVFDSKDSRAGYNMTGEKCNTFSLKKPDPNCPFRPEITFKSTCTAGPCIDQPIIVYVRILYSSDAEYSLNVQERIVEGLR